MGPYYGDIAEDATLDFMWDTANGSGVAITRATNGTINIYKGNSSIATSAGITDTEDFGGLTGQHHCRIDTSADVFYAVNSDYHVALSGAIIDGVSVNSILGSFSIENRNTFPKADYPTNFTNLSVTATTGRVDVASIGGIDASGLINSAADLALSDYGALKPTVAGRTLDVSAGGEAGIDWANVGTPGSTVGLSATTVGTTTTNTDMRGTDSAFLAASAPTNFSDLSITAGNGRVDVESIQGVNASGLINSAQSDYGALKPTVAGRDLDVSSGGEAGIDWANVGTPGSTVGLSATTVGTTTVNTDMRGTDSAFLASSAPTNIGDLSITATTGRVDVESVQGVNASGLLTSSHSDYGALKPTVAGRDLDVSAGGEAGIDWANIGTPGSTVSLSATTINDVANIATVGPSGLIKSAVVPAIIEYGLDHLVQTSVASADVADSSIMSEIVGSGVTAQWSTFDNERASLGALRRRGDLSWITGGAGAAPTSAENAEAIWQYKIRGLTSASGITSDYYPITMSSSGVIGTVNLVNTTTTNTDMRGTDSAFLAASAPTNFSDLSITATTGRVDVESVQGVNASGLINSAISDFGPLKPTVAGRDLDVSTGGEAGIDWANVGTPGTTVSLSATTINDLTNLAGVGPSGLVKSAVVPAIVEYGLDHLVQTSVAAADVADSSIISEIVGSGVTAQWSTFDNVTDSLESIRNEQYAFGKDTKAIIESQRGDHTYQGNVFYVDPVNGDTHANGNRGGADDPYDTVQDCHDNAVTDSNHDLIILVSGAAAGPTTLTEDVTLSKKYLFIRGPGRDFIWTRSGSGDTITITANGIELSGFQLNTAGVGSGNGITATSAGFFKASSLWINDTQGDAIELTDCDNFNIVDCNLQSSGQSGSGHGIVIMAGGGETGNYGFIRNNDISDVSGDGIRLDTTGGGVVDAVTVEHNNIQGCTDNGIDIVDSGVTSTFIVDNRFGNNTSDDISDSGTNTVIINNQQWSYGDASGRTDVGSWLGTAVTTSATTSKPEVDAFSISDDATAANNLELDYDGAGYIKANSTIGTATNVTNLAGIEASGLINSAADLALTDYDAVVPADLPTNFVDLSITATDGRVDVQSIQGVNASGLINSAQSDYGALKPTVAGRDLDVSTGGEAGVDWANVGTPGSTVGLSATTIGVTSNVINLANIEASGLINSAVDLALDTAIPSSPTADSINERIQTMDAGVTLDLTQAVATSHTAETVGDALNAARAQGFGKWTIVGTTLTLFAADGSTAVRTFTLDDATTPTSRT